jgi:hypothetical protein
MAGPDAGAVVAMKVFVEQQMVAPIRITLKFLRTTVHRPAAAFVTQKNPSQAIGDLMRNLEQTRQLARASWTLDFEIVAVIITDRRFENRRVVAAREA